MIASRYLVVGLFFLCFLSGCRKDEPAKPNTGTLQLNSVKAGAVNFSLTAGSTTPGVPVDAAILINFSSAVDAASAGSSVIIKNGTTNIDSDITLVDDSKTISIKPKTLLPYNTALTLSISGNLTGSTKETFPGFDILFQTSPATISLVSMTIGGKTVGTARIIDVPQTAAIVANFSIPLDPATVNAGTILLSGPGSGTLNYELSNENKTLTITRSTPLTYLSKYTVNITNSVKAAAGVAFSGKTQGFFSDLGNHTSGLPALSDEELLDKVQSQTLKYFYDYGHPASGMARERSGSGNTVTTGGSGFGLMAMVAGIDRGFIPRTDGVARFAKIVTFLENADRFHGAWPHWVDGSNGNVIPFSTDDNGADLVETSFLVEGLITVRQYLNPTDTVGNNLINRITKLWRGVEWDWFRQETQKNWLYWHWSPDKAWVMNFALRGYFEEQITYILAASSPTHGIPKQVYVSGFANNGAVNGRSYTFNGESHVLPLGTPSPLFWTQYSYIGMNPHFSDDYANFWTQGVNASLINHAYCAQNPQRYAGYSDSSWGLTASDNPDGYGAQSPENDNGTITPTAALSAFPYTPEQSMKALRFFYDKLGDRIWKDYGFVDAYNVTDNWYANSFLAIDQGPIVGMIENYRSQLLWNLFMSAPEIQQGVNVLEFH